MLMLEMEIAFFIPTRIAGWIISFMLHISLQTDTYIDKSVEIFLKLSMKTVQVHSIIGTTLDNEAFHCTKGLYEMKNQERYRYYIFSR